MTAELSEAEINELFKPTIDLTGRYEKFLAENPEGRDLLSLLQERNDKEWDAGTTAQLWYVLWRLGMVSAPEFHSDEYIHDTGTHTINAAVTRRLKTTVTATKRTNGDEEEVEEEVRAVVGSQGDGYHPMGTEKAAQSAEKNIRSMAMSNIYNNLEAVAISTEDERRLRALETEIVAEVHGIFERVIAKYC